VPFASPTDSPPAEQVGDREVELGFVRDERVVLSSRTVEDPRTTEEVLQLLFAGPSEAEKAAGLSTFLPSTVIVEDVEVTGETAVVSLDGPDDSEVLRLAPLAYAQIVATLTPDLVAGVRFRLDDTDLRVPREDSTLTTEPLSRRDYPGLLSDSASAAPTPSA
jgi:Sporulation and spore germination